MVAMNDQTPVYRIVDWKIHFESSATSKVKRLSWIMVPNATGDGYHDLVEAHGAAGFGFWMALVQCASRAHITRRDGTIRCSDRQFRRDFGMSFGDHPDVIRTLLQLGWLQEVTKTSGRHPEDIRTTSGQHPNDVRNKEEGRKPPNPHGGKASPKPNQLVEVWNRNRGALPEVLKLNDSRKRSAKAALKEEPDLRVWAKAVRILAGREHFVLNGYGFDTLVRPANRGKYLDLARQDFKPAESDDDRARRELDEALERGAL